LIAAALRKTLAEQPLKKEPKTKRKGGMDLHSSDFAYVGGPEDTSTWKLSIHDKAHAQNALARFGQTAVFSSSHCGHPSICSIPLIVRFLRFTLICALPSFPPFCIPVFFL
jgi:hypothetical protein